MLKYILKQIDKKWVKYAEIKKSFSQNMNFFLLIATYKVVECISIWLLMNVSSDL